MIRDNFRHADGLVHRSSWRERDDEVLERTVEKRPVVPADIL